MGDELYSEIRRVLNEAGMLPLDAGGLDEHADLYAAGMSSHASVDVMLELEDTFEIEFPARLVSRSVFSSIDAIAEAIRELRPEAA
jgi:acyl carrier protein